MLSLLSSAAPPPPSLPLSHISWHYFILFYYNKDSRTEHSSDRGGLHMAGGCHKVKCANEKKRKKKERNQGSSSEQCHLIECHFHFHYRKRGSASYIVREWLLWVAERERERRLWRHRYHAKIASDHAYDYLDSALTLCICIRVDAFYEPAAAVECSKCMTSQNHKQQLLRPRSGPSKIQKHIPEQPGWLNSKYWGNIEKRNQINTKNYWK